MFYLTMAKLFIAARLERSESDYIQKIKLAREAGSFSEALRIVLEEHKERLGI